MAFFHTLGFNSVFGLDYSLIGCVAARKNLAILGASGKVICGDIFHLPFEDESFDFVYSLGVIEHFDDPGKVVALVSRILRRGGLMIVGIPNFNGLAGWLQRMIDVAVFHQHMVLDLPDLEKIFRSCNLKPVFVGYVGGFSTLRSVVDWRRFSRRSVLHRLVGDFLTRAVNFAVTTPFRLGIEPNSRLFSPYILGAATRHG